jgi:hypothetical protein
MLPVREDEGGNGEEKQLKKKTKGPNEEKGRLFFSFGVLCRLLIRSHLLRYFSFF